jgi:curved DNA-binding protein CbpA
MDLYEILEIKSNASEIEIKKAYHRLVLKYHPDKNNNTTTDKFQKIQSAYEILINSKTRLEYQKMNTCEQYSFVEILEKVINNNINFDELQKYGFNLNKNDISYIQTNFYNLFQSINVEELILLFKKGIIPKKDFNNNNNNCSESDSDFFDETNADYYYNLPISMQKINKNDIRIELSIKIGDITNINKRKIKIKRNNDLSHSENSPINTTFIFTLNIPYIVFIGGGDCSDGDNYGNLIIKLNLPNNLFWNENIILIEQSMSLYEMIYGFDIHLDLGDKNIINIQNWVSSRDGFLIDVNSINNKLKNCNLGIKLFLNYEDSPEKEQLLKKYFC